MAVSINGKRKGYRRRSVPMSEINVTPFVDVVLVLLIIFMVAAPLLTVGVPIDLPESAAASVEEEMEEPLIVSITAEGDIFLQEEPVAEDVLVGRLSAISEGRESQRVFLRADGENLYGRVAELMGTLQASGFSQIVLVHDSAGDG